MREGSKAGRRISPWAFRPGLVVRAALFHLSVAALLFLYVDDAAFRATYHRGRPGQGPYAALFRSLGRTPGVALGALVLWYRKRERRRWLLALALAAGTLAVFSEFASRSVCRARPREAGGRTVFFPYFHRLTDGRLPGQSFSSGDVTAAFAVATVLAAAVPEAAVAFFALALGVVYWRISSGSHFASDTYLSAVIAWYGARGWLIVTGCGPPRAGAGGLPPRPPAPAPRGIRCT